MSRRCMGRKTIRMQRRGLFEEFFSFGKNINDGVVGGGFNVGPILKSGNAKRVKPGMGRTQRKCNSFSPDLGRPKKRMRCELDDDPFDLNSFLGLGKKCQENVGVSGGEVVQEVFSGSGPSFDLNKEAEGRSTHTVDVEVGEGMMADGEDPVSQSPAPFNEFEVLVDIGQRVGAQLQEDGNLVHRLLTKKIGWAMLVLGSTGIGGSIRDRMRKGLSWFRWIACFPNMSARTRGIVGSGGTGLPKVSR
ncbi:hypothetical protein L1987_02492 [Smallanthus sonchifolius]|uniref:Uncharacterized protein n=1 Tax=Smallanthus sonchifolius TaxID=185202 RepID=A0ACB9K7V7_9ASTR|nr:hypothetical protein L1987_02492 [Smallanthus sonchifolius]